MWGNFSNIVSDAIETAQKFGNDIEEQLDASVGVEKEKKNPDVEGNSRSVSPVPESNSTSVSPVPESMSPVPETVEPSIMHSSSSVESFQSGRSTAQKKRRTPMKKLSTKLLVKEGNVAEKESNEDIKGKVENSTGPVICHVVEEAPAGDKSPSVVASAEATIESKAVGGSSTDENVPVAKDLLPDSLPKADVVASEEEEKDSNATTTGSELNNAGLNRTIEKVETLDVAKDVVEIECSFANEVELSVSNQVPVESSLFDLVSSGSIDKDEMGSVAIEEIEAVAASVDWERHSKILFDSQLELVAEKELSEERLEELSQSQAMVSKLKGCNEQILNDVVQLKGVVAERERSLESTSTALSELTKLHGEQDSLISNLKEELMMKDEMLLQKQSSVAVELELKRQLAKCNELLSEKDGKLLAFEQEGQSLSKKQSELEKAIRKVKAENKEKDAELIKVKEHRDQLTKSLDAANETLKKKDSDANIISKNLMSIQAESNTSSDRLVKAEADVVSKSEELIVQRTALEQSWNDSKELKKIIGELKAELDHSKVTFEDKISRIGDNESLLRDSEQRENILNATNEQLQQSLQRHMTDSSLREERLSLEAKEMRTRWQEAVHLREQLSSELTDVTSPLLRQLSSLQESFRSKSDHWQTVESELLEKNLRSGLALETAERKCHLIEEEFGDLEQRLTKTTHSLKELNASHNDSLDAISKLETEKRKLNGVVEELESTLARQSATQSRELRDAYEQAEAKRKMEVDQLRQQWEEEKELEVKAQAKADLLIQHRQNGLKGSKSADGLLLRSDTASTEVIIANNSLDHGMGGSPFETPMKTVKEEDDRTPGNTPGMLFVTSESLLHHQLIRDEVTHSMTQQFDQLNAARSALLDEVSFLSCKNAELNEQCTSLAKQSSGRIGELTTQNELLLSLLGEKTEEFENLCGDMQEVKYLYKDQIEQLMNIVAPCSSAVTAVPNTD